MVDKKLNIYTGDFNSTQMDSFTQKDPGSEPLKQMGISIEGPTPLFIPMNPMTEPAFIEASNTGLMKITGDDWLPVSAYLKRTKDVKFHLLSLSFEGKCYLGVKNQGPAPVMGGSSKWSVKIRKTDIITAKTNSFNIPPMSEGEVEGSFKMSGKGVLAAIWDLLKDGKADFNCFGTLYVGPFSKTFQHVLTVRW